MEPNVIPRPPALIGVERIQGRLPSLDSLEGLTGALHRAMPYTRLVDCGMSPPDARELLWRTADGEEWEQVAEEISLRQRDRAHQARSTGSLVTARHAARAAVAAANFAQMMHNEDSPAKTKGYARYRDAVELYAELMEERMEEVRMPYAHGHLDGWLHRPGDTSLVGTVVMWGGLSGWGASYLGIADALNDRGLACLLVEGPGQGMPRIRDGIYASEDTIDGFGAFVSWVAENPRLPDGIALLGNSFGGLPAARVAAADDRVKACAINGAPARPTVPSFRAAREQILGFTGAEDVEQAQKILDGLAIDPTRHRTSAAVLVLQGGADPLLDRDAQQPFLEMSDHSPGTFLWWEDGEHTLYNHAEERNSLLADWFVSVLSPSA